MNRFPHLLGRAGRLHFKGAGRLQLTQRGVDPVEEIECGFVLIDPAMSLPLIAATLNQVYEKGNEEKQDCHQNG